MPFCHIPYIGNAKGIDAEGDDDFIFVLDVVFALTERITHKKAGDNIYQYWHKKYPDLRIELLKVDIFSMLFRF